jgi:hypothetical protein
LKSASIMNSSKWLTSKVSMTVLMLFAMFTPLWMQSSTLLSSESRIPIRLKQIDVINVKKPALINHFLNFSNRCTINW